MRQPLQCSLSLKSKEFEVCKLSGGLEQCIFRPQNGCVFLGINLNYVFLGNWEVPELLGACLEIILHVHCIRSSKCYFIHADMGRD